MKFCPSLKVKSLEEVSRQGQELLQQPAVTLNIHMACNYCFKIGLCFINNNNNKNVYKLSCCACPGHMLRKQDCNFTGPHCPAALMAWTNKHRGVIQHSQVDELVVNNSPQFTYSRRANNCIWQTPDWEEKLERKKKKKLGVEGLHEEEPGNKNAANVCIGQPWFSLLAITLLLKGSLGSSQQSTEQSVWSKNTKCIKSVGSWNNNLR